MNEADATYLQSVFAKMSSSPTDQDLDFLVESFARVGFLAAQAQGLAEQAEANRKHREAETYLAFRQAANEIGEKVTERQAEAYVALQCKDVRDEEIEARVRARKIQNLLDGIEQVINAVKYAGRHTEPTNQVRLPK